MSRERLVNVLLREKTAELSKFSRLLTLTELTQNHPHPDHRWQTAINGQGKKNYRIWRKS
jgi:hypothetical protein